jgi:hypothetical protein
MECRADGCQRCRQAGRLLERDQDHDGARVERGQPSRRLDAVHPGHPHVEQHDVRFQRGGHFEGFGPEVAAPTCLKPGVSAISWWAARRKIGWSSTARTVTAASGRSVGASWPGPLAGLTVPMLPPSLWGGKGESCDRRGGTHEPPAGRLTGDVPGVG